MTRIMTFAAMSLALLSATAEPRCEAIMSVQGETAVHSVQNNNG